jgi:Luciferase
MIFNLVVRHFRWLARIPGMPHFFDALLTAGTWAFYPQRLSAMEKLEREALSLTGVQLSVHRFGGIEFVDANGRELGHLHGHGLLDVLVGRERAETLIANGRVRRHHVLPHSGWVSFQIESAADVSFALELLTRETNQ